MERHFALVILALPFLAGLAIPAASRGQRKYATAVMLVTTAVCLLLTALLFPSIADHGVLRQSYPWAPAIGLDFIVRVDGLSWLFMLLISGIGLLVGIYSNYYMPREETLVRFFALLLGFMGAMLGIVTSGNAIQLVFFWELTSLFSFLLVGYWHQGESARDAARTALIVTAAGGLCLLAGVILLGQMAGSYDIDAILAASDRIQSSPLYLPALILVLLGAFTKSAQFPFHFWLPQAMSAPTPVSAYLHSATLVKAGVFLLLRFWPVLAGTSTWFWLVGGVGMVSLLLGGWAAIFQRDLKALLAYSTISHLGLIVMLMGLGGRLGAVAAIFHTINHATFKASLFMAAGAVDHETGTRDLERLSGLRHVMPITATLAIISSAAMAGVPMLNGFLSKEMFFAVTVGSHQNPALDAVTTIMAITAAALGVTYSLRLVGGAFFGQPHSDYPRQPHEPAGWMRFPIGFLALACLAVGTVPALVVGRILHVAGGSVLGQALPAYNLAVWHGLNAPLFMSVIAFLIGCALYFALKHHFSFSRAVPVLENVSAKRVFEHLILFVTTTLPGWQARVFPSRRLQVQLLLVVLVAGLLTTLAVAPWLTLSGLPPGTPIDPVFALLWLLGAVCAVGAAAHARFHRMTALALTGGAGLIVCLNFVLLSAPDLAVTQLLVESVTTVLILLGLRWLPRRIPGVASPRRGTRFRRHRDLLIAVGAGAGLAVLSYAVMLYPVSDSVSQFFLDQAEPAGGGHNVVNIILVDFRALDTLGEITVLVIVALSVFALLRRFRPPAESLGMTRQQKYFRRLHKGRSEEVGELPDYLAIPAALITLLAPLFVLFGIHLLLRGHGLPGGGFAAGITLTLALIVLYMARGARWVEARLRVVPVRWIGVGLLLALFTGILGIVVGKPFLTSYHSGLDVPLLGTIPIQTALLFDIGVFAVVVGASSLILLVLAHQVLRRPSRRAATAAPDQEKRQWN